MAMTEYVVEKENHHSGAEIIRVNSDKLFELSGNPHVKRINVLEKWENGKWENWRIGKNCKTGKTN